MKKAVSVALIAVAFVISGFTISTLLSPQLSSGIDGIGGQLEVKEAVWDGGILNGDYHVTIANPTDRIIEASIYVYAQNKENTWRFLRCGEDSFSEDNLALIVILYPNSEIELHTDAKDSLFSESVKFVAVSGDKYLLERTVSVTKFVKFEFVSVEWGEMVNISYEPETARFLNFTLFNNGLDTSIWPDQTQFRLTGFIDGGWSYHDTRGQAYKEGLTSFKMIGNTEISKYRLYYDDKLLWEGIVL